MTKIIRFFSSFCDSSNCKEVYERLCEVVPNDKYRITTGDDYNFAVIINTAMPKLNVSKENVIGLAFEPVQFLGLSQQFIEYAINNIGKYYIGDTTVYNLPKPFTEHYAYMWHTTPLKSIPVKNISNNIMSIMISQKTSAPGHKYRHLLTQEILKRNLPVDIYGRGCRQYNDNINIMGEFKEIEPYEKYKFHIAIENFQTQAYFSEKITNPLLCGTIPIYLGCKTIEKYFPNETIKLYGNINMDIQLIEDILKNPEKYNKKINIDSIKNTINLFNNII